MLLTVLLARVPYATVAQVFSVHIRVSLPVSAERTHGRPRRCHPTRAGHRDKKWLAGCASIRECLIKSSCLLLFGTTQVLTPELTKQNATLCGTRRADSAYPPCRVAVKVTLPGARVRVALQWPLAGLWRTAGKRSAAEFVSNGR